MAAANDEMSAALTRLVAVAEAYPELKSDAVYTSLMDELSDSRSGSWSSSGGGGISSGGSFGGGGFGGGGASR